MSFPRRSLFRVVPSLVLSVALAGAAEAQTTHDVSQNFFSFIPQDVTVQGGDTVRWTWSNSMGHTVTEGTNDILEPGDAFHYILESGNPIVEHVFDTKFLFENPRAGDVYPYVCIPHFSFGMIGTVTVNSPWEDRGFAKAGSFGDPLLYGNGPLTSSSANELVLESANPSSASVLFIGLAEGDVPFKGGTLVPFPLILQVDLFTLPGGGFQLPFVMPPGLSGIDLYLQAAIQDPGATKNVSLSNGVKMTGQ